MDQRFIFEQNIQRFRGLLASTPDAERARLLQRLLDAELKGLSACEEQMAPNSQPHPDESLQEAMTSAAPSAPPKSSPSTP